MLFIHVKESLLILVLINLEVSTCFDVIFDLPNQLTYNKEQNVVLTVFDGVVGDRVNVTINMKPENFSDERNSFFIQESFFITESSLETHLYLIRANWTSEAWHAKSDDDDIMFYVIIEFFVTTSSGTHWQQEKKLPVAKIKGHIFIKTDRPVYQPQDKVHVRFIPVDDEMKPLNQAMEMRIMAPNPNSDGPPLLSWTKTKVASKDVFVRSFELPQTPPIGKWIVFAKFYRDEVIAKEFHSSFYVGDITLPTFDLKIRPTANYFILPDDEDFSIDVLASFIYGEPLDGSATVRIGLYNRLWENPLINSYVLSPLSVRNGLLSLNIQLDNLTDGQDSTLLFRSDTRLFVEVSVTERGGGQTRSTRNTDVMLTSSPIVLNIDSMSSYFKPGLPFIIQAQASFINGSLATNLSLIIEATALLRNGRRSRLINSVISTSDKGKIFRNINVSDEVERLSITVRGHFDSHAGKSYVTEASKEVYRQNSTSDQYLQILFLTDGYAVGLVGAVELYMTPAAVSRTIVYSVSGRKEYSRQYIIQADPNQSRILITFPIVSKMSPSFYLTAYFVTTTPTGLQSIVADSVLLEVEDICHGRELNTFVLHPTDDIYPGQSLELDVMGQPGSVVGISGVDSAAASLRKDFENDDNEKLATLTRENLFAVMKTNLPGCENPLKPRPEASFSTTGRTLLSTIFHNTDPSTVSSCVQEEVARRRKRSISSSTLRGSIFNENVDSAEHFLGIDFECCAVGASDVTSVTNSRSCQKRAKTVSLGLKCKERFLDCCNRAERMRVMESLVASRSTFRQSYNVISVYEREMPVYTGHSFMDEAMQLTRSDFSWTWFNADFKLGRNGITRLSNQSRPSIPSLPGSITSWSLDAYSLSKTEGMCIMDPVEFTVDHSLYIEVKLPEGVAVTGKLMSIEVTVYSYLLEVVTANLSLLVDKDICTEKNKLIKIRNLSPSNGEVASTQLHRFNVIPLTPGSHDIKIKMEATYNGLNGARGDTVIKTLLVEREGVKQQDIEWILVEEKNLNKKISPKKTTELAPFEYPIPAKSIPGSEKVVLRVHSVVSATIREPITTLDEGSAQTIAQYLYTLQFIISKMKMSQNELNKWDRLSLSDKAQCAYNGLLRYVRNRSNGKKDILFGFSYSPAEKAKPDLWLTSVTLRIICQVSELVEIFPDEKLLRGTLNWILSHQNRKKKGYFANKPILKTRSSLKYNPISKRSIFKTLSRSRNSNGDHKSRMRRQAKIKSKIPSNFKSKLDVKIYRTSTVSASLNSVLITIGRSPDQFHLRPSAFDSIDLLALRDSLRRALHYIGSNVVKVVKRPKKLSPLTLTAASRAMFMLSGRRKLALEKAINKSKLEENDQKLWWIKNDNFPANREPTNHQQQLINSSSIEATAYALQLYIFTGARAKNYANWLLKQRQSNNRWMTLKDTIASMMSLETHALESLKADENNPTAIKISSPVTSELTVLSPIGIGPAIVNEIELPTTSSAVNMTLMGSGSVWVELYMAYNLPTSNQDELNKMESLCPFDFYREIRPAGSSTPGVQVFARATSSSKWEITIGARYKAWYDPSEHGDPSYVIDFGLHSNYVPITYYLDQLCNPIEKMIDYYRISKRSVLFYLSEERNFTFQITDKRMPAEIHPLPIKVYPVAIPELSCTFYYSLPGTPAPLTSFCSNSNNTRTSDTDTCLCAATRSCPKVLTKKKSSTISTAKRLEITCKNATKFAYRVRMEGSRQEGSDWLVYYGVVQRIYKKSAELQGVENDRNYTFWMRRSCDVSKILPRKNFLLIGRSAVQTPDGMFKHLLDSHARMELWPRYDDCSRFKGRTLTVCLKLNDFNYQMITEGCGTENVS